MVREIPVSRGLVALVDDEDYERVAALKWHADPVDYQHLERNDYYAKRTMNNDRKLFLHRFILNITDGRRVDHRNGDGLDCRRSNLRIASKSQNSANAKKRIDSKQPFKGIRKSSSGRWQSRIRINGQVINLGSFDTAEDAARAYDDAARKHFGPFARLNLPESGERAA